MKRLGLWPPQPGAKYKWATQKEEAELEKLYNQLIALRAPMLGQLDEMDKSISAARQQLRNIGNEKALAQRIEALIAEVRSRRIARVKEARALRKERQAQEEIENAQKYQVWRVATIPHLGREVSKGLKYEGSDEEKLRAAGLPILHSAADLAQLLEISTGKLAWLSYHRAAAPNDHYRHFTIAKKSGGRRAISAPKGDLKSAQSRVLEAILSKVEVHAAACAFRPGLSIAHNAQAHAGAAIVLRVDLKDFFPSITFRRVKWTFESLGYNEGVSTICALLCSEAPRAKLTFDGEKHCVALGDRFLPQGAPTSPALTNILCRRMDKKLTGAARKFGFVYTRYADDLVFSARDAKADLAALRRLIEKIVADEKFVINADKTMVMRAHNRQTVTGIVINERAGNVPDTAQSPRISRRDLRRFRAFLHHYEKQGREAMTEKLGRDSLSYARGYLSFCHMVSPAHAENLRQAHPWLARQD